MNKINEEIPPKWFDGKKINEALFCTEYVKDFPTLCINGTFFTTNGLVKDEGGIRQEIYNRIKPYVMSGISNKKKNFAETV